MKTPRRAPVLALLLLLPAVLAHAAVRAPDAAWLQRQVEILAGPGMEGRGAGTAGGDRAIHHLAAALAAAGLRPGGDDGSFLQSFPVASGTALAPGNVLEILHPAPRALAVGRDYVPHGGSPSRQVSGEIVVAGHGIMVPDKGRDDCGGQDVRGRIVLAMAGGPQSRLEKLVAARERGAAALLLVDERLPALDATATAVDLPSATLTAEAADRLLAGTGIDAGGAGPAGPRATGVRARLAVALATRERTSANVIGVLPGTDPVRTAEAIVVGAHHDHLGHHQGAVHPGADDNASGTAVVLGLARAFAAAGGAPRTLVFALFGAEEIGLVGSRHHVRQPAVPLERTVAMLNFDMVGRLRDGRLSVGGVASGAGLRAVVTAAAQGLDLDPALRDGPFSPSDHLSFYSAGVPVLFFHTGVHADYHRPGDTADKIDADGMARVAALGARVIERLADAPRPLYVKLAPPASRPRTARPADGAFFGIMADGRRPGDGVRVASVVPGTAAARLGLAEGDVIVRLDDTSVSGFEAFREAVRARRPGDRVQVVYLRGGEPRRGAETLGTPP